MNPVDEFTSIFTSEKITDVMQLKRNFFQVKEDMLKVKKSILQEPFSAGVFLGSGNPLHPSTALLDWLGERSERFAILDKKSSWLFLCGRDIFAESVLKKNVSEGKVLIKNEAHEVLGYGIFTARDKKIPIKNLLDKGDFIRREKR